MSELETAATDGFEEPGIEGLEDGGATIAGDAQVGAGDDQGTGKDTVLKAVDDPEVSEPAGRADDSGKADKVNVAVDDGYATIKLVTVRPDGKLLRHMFPSRLRAGAIGINNFVSNDYAPIYETEGLSFTVTLQGESETTRFNEYHMSNINRVLINHALCEAGLFGEAVRLGTSVPINEYYRHDGQHRDDIIKDKIDSLRKPVVLRSGDGKVAMPDIVDSHVFPEGLAALMDVMIDDKYAMHGNESTVAVVDIGGQTTDFVVLWPEIQLDHSLSGSINVGMMDIQKQLQQYLCNKHNLKSISSSGIEQALLDGTINLFGNVEKLDESVRQEMIMPTAESIAHKCSENFGQAAEIGKILFVGGGAKLLFETVIGILGYNNAVLHDDPMFANARGMLKILHSRAG